MLKYSEIKVVVLSTLTEDEDKLVRGKGRYGFTYLIILMLVNSI